MKILIADDELVSRMKLDKLVQSLGHETLVAENGEEGWHLWKQERTRMVITDWVMPRMTGLELCIKIRENEGDDYTYIIIVSSQDSDHDVIKGMEAGADDYITKPFNKDELYVRLKAGERVINLQSKDMVIFVVAKLAESRDTDTGYHLERIRYYSKALCQEIQRLNNFEHEEIDNLFIDNIFLTSPLHDIGKIGIPDHILHKPGRLDDEEFDIMKTHTTIGFDTLNTALEKYPKAGYLKMSADIARSHHEKFNGTGYPDGIEGEAIPLSARIVALSDVYDALVTKRVYKDAYSHGRAKSIILKDRDTHFDSRVVDAFLSCEDTFIRIAGQFRDELPSPY